MESAWKLGTELICAEDKFLITEALEERKRGNNATTTNGSLLSIALYHVILVLADDHTANERSIWIAGDPVERKDVQSQRVHIGQSGSLPFCPPTFVLKSGVPLEPLLRTQVFDEEENKLISDSLSTLMDVGASNNGSFTYELPFIPSCWLEIRKASGTIFQPCTCALWQRTHLLRYPEVQCRPRDQSKRRYSFRRLYGPQPSDCPLISSTTHKQPYWKREASGKSTNRCNHRNKLRRGYTSTVSQRAFGSPSSR